MAILDIRKYLHTVKNTVGFYKRQRCHFSLLHMTLLEQYGRWLAGMQYPDDPNIAALIDKFCVSVLCYFLRLEVRRLVFCGNPD